MSQPLPNQTQLRRDRPVCRRMLLLLFVLLAGFSLVTWRLAVIQIKESQRLSALAAKKYQRHIVLPAHRGAIKDFNGEYLAHDEDVSELYTDRTHLREIITVRHHLAAIRGIKAVDLRDQLDEKQTLAAYHEHVAHVLASVLPMPEAEIRSQITSEKPEIVLAKQVDEETAKEWDILFKAEHIVGIHLRPTVARRFPAKDRLSLVLGDTDTANKGRWGIEKLKDADLTGISGEQFIERDKSGHELPAYRGQVIEPQHGCDVHLTIDMQLQDNVEAICERAWLANKARRVVIVVTEPTTGTILAMAARPHRDVSNPDVSTWTNHAIAEPYEPGSIFKVVTLAAALDNNKVTPGERIDCGNMFYEDPVRKVKLSDDEPLGMQTVKGVLVHSSNIGMYKISKRVGQDMMLDYASRFGFGSVTGIGLVGEKAGYMNTGKWSNTTYSRMPIGYEVSVTPLQMCMAYGAIANGGVLMKPRLIDRVVKPNGEAETTPSQPVWQVCTAKTAASLRDFLEGVVLEGTGSRAALPDVRVGGKTGTTRRYDPEKRRYIDGSYLTSFVGIAPVEKPQVVCLVMLDDPKAESEKMIRGGRVAAPIFAEVVRETLDHLAIRHQQPVKVAAKGGCAMILRDLIPHLDKPAVSGSLDTEITGLAYDSRKVGPGIAFVALRGNTADGHDYIPKAIELGAAAIIAEQAPPDDVTIPWVHVRLSRIALAQAAAALNGHPAKALTLAGVTGTNGKTTTAFILHHLFNVAQMRSGLLGTVFYDLGNGEHIPATHTTPESLEIQGLLASMRDNGCRACAMEVSSHALDQDRVFGLPFEAAIFTNLTQDHLDYHGTMEKYFEAKVRLFETTSQSPRSALIINGDDSWGRKLAQRFEHTGRVTRFGFGVGCEFRAINVRYDLTGTTFELEAKGRSFLVRSPLIGDFNVYNALGALAAAHGVGLNLREAVKNLQSVPQVPGRMERVSENSRFQVFVDYAHTPDGIENAVRTARALRPRRLITVFGCGGDRDRTKRPKMAAAAEAGSDICVLTSDNPRTEDPEQILNDAKAGFARPQKHAVIADRRLAIQTALQNAWEGDLVLIAGKGHEDYQDIQGKKHPFDDRKIARYFLHQLKAERAAEREERDAEREAMRGGFDRPDRFDR